MEAILDEAVADKEVIKSLIKHITQLNKLVKGSGMTKILMDTEGKLYSASVYEEVTEHDLREQADEAREQAAEVERAIEKAASLRPASNQVPAADPAPAQPATPAQAPAAPTTPAVEQPAQQVTLQ